MKKAKHNDAKKHPKEYAENLWGSKSKHNHAKEGTESFIRQKENFRGVHDIYSADKFRSLSNHAHIVSEKML